MHITFKARIIKIYDQIIAISLGQPRYRNMDMTPLLSQAICGDSAIWGTRKYKYPLFVKYLTIIERKIIVQNVPTVDKVLVQDEVVLNSQQPSTHWPPAAPSRRACVNCNDCRRCCSRALHRTWTRIAATIVIK